MNLITAAVVYTNMSVLHSFSCRLVAVHQEAALFQLKHRLRSGSVICHKEEDVSNTEVMGQTHI